MLEQADQYQMGSQNEELGLLAATCLRHQGEVAHAEHIYREIRERLSMSDERLADVMIGLADCAHLRGDFAEAGKLARAASQILVTSTTLALRVRTTGAHIQSHLNVEEAVAAFKAITKDFPAAANTAWANFLFQFADVLLVAGLYPLALAQFLAAHALASETGATITLADSMRRLPLVRILVGHNDYALRGVNDLNLAEQLYEVAGDRGAAYLHTEAGEVYRALGRYREAERSFTRGLWATRQINDVNRIAHNQLGLFEVGRAAGQPRWEALEDALHQYQSIGSDWGIIHTTIAQGLASPTRIREHLQRAGELIEASTFSEFPRERELLARLAGMSDADAMREAHIMNYP